MNSGVIYTSANLGYLDRALVLLESIRKHEPSYQVVLLLVDEFPSEVKLREALRAFDDVVPASTLAIPDFPTWLFGHNLVEACTAVKGAALKLLLSRGHSHVLYLDPDIVLFGPFTAVHHALSSASILLTPHQVSSELEEWAIEDNEITSLKTGTYNFGFLAVRNDSTGREFGSWWATRLHKYCMDNIERGLFTDQRWGDLVPALFEDVGVLRDPGLNVASWNLHQRELQFGVDGALVVDQTPVSFFHFTKALGVGPLVTMKQSRGSLVVAAVWRWYLERLRELGADLAPRTWAYGCYDNGTPIDDKHRRLYRGRRDLQAAFPNPYSTVGKDSYLRWLAESLPADGD